MIRRKLPFNRPDRNQFFFKRYLWRWCFKRRPKRRYLSCYLISRRHI